MDLELATIEDIAAELRKRPLERDYVIVFRDTQGQLQIDAKPGLKVKKIAWMLSYYVTNMIAFLSTDQK